MAIGSVVVIRPKCSSMKADAAHTGPEATPADASVSSDRMGAKALPELHKNSVHAGCSKLGCGAAPGFAPSASDAVPIDSVPSPLGGAVRRRAHRITSPLPSGPASSGRIQSGASLALPDADDPGTRAGPAIGRLPTARGSARPAPALYWLAGPIVKLVAGNKPWSGPRSYCWRSRASRRRAIPRRPSSSTATSGRSSRTTASSATGPTRPSARPTCGSTSGGVGPGRSRRPPRRRPGRSGRERALPPDHRRGRRRTDAAGRSPARPSSPTQIELIRRWIDAGGEVAAALGVHPAAAAADAPRSSDRGWVRNPIDAFVLARLEREGLAPSPEAERGDADPPRHARPDRPAADAGEVDAFLADTSPGRLREGGRSPAGLAALRRADGRPLARRRPLRRHQRLSDRRRARSCGGGATG